MHVIVNSTTMRLHGGCGSGLPLAPRLRRPLIDLQASRSPLRLIRYSSRVHGLRPGCRLRSCARGEPTRPPPWSGSHAGRYDYGPGLVEEPRSDWRRAVAVVSERRVAKGRALYTERSCSSCCGVVQGGPEQRARALRPAGEPTRSEAALHQPRSELQNGACILANAHRPLHVCVRFSRNAATADRKSSLM